METILKNAPLYFPEGRESMWSYCVYLGPYTDSHGNNYDMGILLRHGDEYGRDHSAACVWGSEPHQYTSGELKVFAGSEIHDEVSRRAKELNLI
jgi:hypothetical protein